MPRCASCAKARSYTPAVSASLRRFKEDASEVRTGFECGIGVSNFNDVKVGDVLECFAMQKQHSGPSRRKVLIRRFRARRVKKQNRGLASARCVMPPPFKEVRECPSVS